jgi:Tol biopolymer transport system component
VSGSRPLVSGNGRIVAFHASRVTGRGQATDERDSGLFVHDRSTGVTRRLEGIRGLTSVASYSLSRDGRYLAIADRGGARVRDLKRGSVQTVLTIPRRRRGRDWVGAVALSGNGRHLAFAANADQLGAATSQVFMHDLRRRTTALVSVDTAGKSPATDAFAPAISHDGARIAFTVKQADGPIATTTAVSADNGGAMHGLSGWPAISSDGSVVVFTSGSALLPHDTNDVADVYLTQLPRLP